MATTDGNNRPIATPFLLGVLATIIFAVAAFGFNDLGNKVDVTAYNEHKDAQIRQDEKEYEQNKIINEKLDMIIGKMK